MSSRAERVRPGERLHRQPGCARLGLGAGRRAHAAQRQAPSREGGQQECDGRSCAETHRHAVLDESRRRPRRRRCFSPVASMRGNLSRAPARHRRRCEDVGMTPFARCPSGRRSSAIEMRSRRCTSATSSQPIPRAASGCRREAAGIYLDYAKQRVTAETIELLVRLAEARGLPARIEAMFRGEPINVTEDRPALHVALRMPRGAHSRRGRPRRRAGGARRARPDAGLRRRGSLRGVARAHGGKPDPGGRQHRHRWLGPRPGDGLRGPAPLHRPRARVPLRVERRRHRLRRGDPRPRPGGDAVRRLRRRRSRRWRR